VDVSVTALLDRLRGVKQSGSGRWNATCPAHEDKSPSLSICELSDGRVLLHCFAQCGAIAVLEAVGLGWGDVFPEKLEVGERQRIPASWALEVLAHESLVVGLIASDIASGKAISDVDAGRACVAAGRIASIAERAHGG
jgi:hypothetical protein